jgi:hypothetical protein
LARVSAVMAAESARFAWRTVICDIRFAPARAASSPDD